MSFDDDGADDAGMFGDGVEEEAIPDPIVSNTSFVPVPLREPDDVEGLWLQDEDVMPTITYMHPQDGGTSVTRKGFRPAVAFCINVDPGRMQPDYTTLASPLQGGDMMKQEGVDSLQALIGFAIAPFIGCEVKTGTPRPPAAQAASTGYRFAIGNGHQTYADCRYAIENIYDASIEAAIEALQGAGGAEDQEEDANTAGPHADSELTAQRIRRAISEEAFDPSRYIVAQRVWGMVQNSQFQHAAGVNHQIKKNFDQRHEAQHAPKIKVRKAASEDCQLKQHSVNAYMTVHDYHELANVYRTYAGDDGLLAGATPSGDERQTFDYTRVTTETFDPATPDAHVLSYRTMLCPPNNHTALTSGMPLGEDGVPNIYNVQAEVASYFPQEHNDRYCSTADPPFGRRRGSVRNGNINWDVSKNAFIVPPEVSALGGFFFFDPNKGDDFRSATLPPKNASLAAPPRLVRIFLEANKAAIPMFSNLTPKDALAQRCFISYYHGGECDPRANMYAQDVVKFRRERRHAAEEFARQELADGKTKHYDPQKHLFVEHARVSSMIDAWYSRGKADISATHEKVPGESADATKLRKEEKKKAMAELDENFALARREYYELVWFRVGVMLQCDTKKLSHGVQVRLAAGEKMLALLPGNSVVMNQLQPTALNGHTSKGRSPFGDMMTMHAVWANYVVRYDNHMVIWFAVYLKCLEPTLVNQPGTTALAKFRVQLLGLPSAGKSYMLLCINKTLPPSVGRRLGTNSKTSKKNGDGEGMNENNGHPCFREEADLEESKPGTTEREEFKTMSMEGELLHDRTVATIGANGAKGFKTESITTTHEETVIQNTNDGIYGGSADFPDKPTVNASCAIRYWNFLFRTRSPHLSKVTVNFSELMKRPEIRNGKLIIDVMDYLITLLMVLRNSAPGLDPDYSYAADLLHSLNHNLQEQFQTGMSFCERRKQSFGMKVKVLTMMHAVYMTFIFAPNDAFQKELRPREKIVMGEDGQLCGGQPLESPAFSLRQLMHCIPMLLCPTPEILSFAWMMTCYECPHLSPMHSSIMLSCAELCSWDVNAMLYQPDADASNVHAVTLKRPKGKGVKSVDNTKANTKEAVQQASKKAFQDSGVGESEAEREAEAWANHHSSVVSCAKRLSSCRQATYQHAKMSQDDKVDLDLLKKMQPTLGEALTFYEESQLNLSGPLFKLVRGQAGAKTPIPALEQQAMIRSRMDMRHGPSLLAVSQVDDRTKIYKVHPQWGTIKGCNSAKGLARRLNNVTSLSNKGLPDVLTREMIQYSMHNVKFPCRMGPCYEVKEGNVDPPVDLGDPPDTNDRNLAARPDFCETAGWCRNSLAQRICDAAVARGALKQAQTHMYTGKRDQVTAFSSQQDPESDGFVFCVNLEVMRRHVALRCEAQCAMSNVNGAGCAQDPLTAEDSSETRTGLPDRMDVIIIYMCMRTVQQVIAPPGEDLLLTTPFETFQSSTRLFQVPGCDLVDPSKVAEQKPLKGSLYSVTARDEDLAAFAGHELDNSTKAAHREMASTSRTSTIHEKDSWYIWVRETLAKNGMLGRLAAFSKDQPAESVNYLQVTNSYDGNVTRNILPEQLKHLYTNDVSKIGAPRDPNIPHGMDMADLQEERDELDREHIREKLRAQKTREARAADVVPTFYQSLFE